MPIQEIVTNIEARIAALTSEIQPLIDARAALLGTAPTPARQRRARAKAAAAPVAPVGPEPEAKAQAREASHKPTPRKRTPKQKADPVPAEKLIMLLEASGGATATALAKEAGGSVAQVGVLLNELADRGQVRRTGERRSTRWYLITDEDRIRARAAEIEAQSNGNVDVAAEPVTADAGD
jgi:hypothetical protein